MVQHPSYEFVKYYFAHVVVSMSKDEERIKQKQIVFFFFVTFTAASIKPCLEGSLQAYI